MSRWLWLGVSGGCSMKIDTSELRKLTADLEGAGPRVVKATATAIRKGGRRIESKAERLAPRGATGELAASIEATFYGDGRSGSVTAVIGPTKYYGLFQERGTAHHAPQPFMGPALDAESPRVVAEIEAAAAQGVLS